MRMVIVTAAEPERMVHVDFDCLFGKGGTSVSGLPAFVMGPAGC